MAQSSSNNSLNSRRTASMHGHTPTHSHDATALPYHWHDKQELMQKELEEARARASQMEKTMRWWSDCTANWREKWSKVRSERNKAREEVRLLRSRLEAFQRDVNALQRQKHELEIKFSGETYNGIIRNDEELPGLMSCSEIGLRSSNKNYNNYSDSPERDNNLPARLNSRPATIVFSCEKLDMLGNTDVSNASLINEALLSCGIDRLGKGVENVSVYSHSAGDASKLSKKCRSFREKDSNSIRLLDEKGLFADASSDGVDLQDLMHKGNDLNDKIDTGKLQVDATFMEATFIEGSSGHSSSQQSPHRVIGLSDTLTETCHASPRISAISDPLSDVCGVSECSETGYAESIRSSEGVIGKRWKTNDRAQSGVSSSILDDSGITPEQESLEQQVTMLKLRLEEASKTIQVERDEKLSLDREKSKGLTEIAELRTRLEDIKASRQEAVKELISLRDVHQQEVQTLQLEMLDEASSREHIDRRLSDLRAELERLQEENAAEWGRRERLQTEKLNIDRENKKLKSQITDLEDRLQKRNKMASSTTESDVSSLRDEISQKSKELTELKHSHNKLKKVLGDKSIDLQHSNKRADQYESEVKRLRSRVDELKKELAAAEDEVDSASNNIRKLHRSNDELQESVENLEVQVEHLRSRLRSSQTTSVPSLSQMEDSDDEKCAY